MKTAYLHKLWGCFNYQFKNTWKSFSCYFFIRILHIKIYKVTNSFYIILKIYVLILKNYFLVIKYFSSFILNRIREKLFSTIDLLFFIVLYISILLIFLYLMTYILRYILYGIMLTYWYIDTCHLYTRAGWSAKKIVLSCIMSLRDNFSKRYLIVLVAQLLFINYKVS